jgi:hypothetical protein
MSVRWENGVWGGEGHIGIPAGKVRGIRNARVDVTYSEGTLDARGNAELDVPGIQRGTMRVTYSEAGGLLVGGSFELANNVPGIRSGSVEAQVQKRPQASEWDVTARGTAVPAIPGFDSQLTIAYDNGAITIEGRGSFNRGMLSGSVQVGATNRAIGPDGQPTGEPTDTLTAWGGGQVTARLTPWLQGTIGLTISREGEITVSGEIGLPSTLEVFPARRYDRNIFTIGLDVPIIGVAAFGQRIGIFATIQGGLDLSAGFGPGQLRDLRLHIDYTPAHEEQTHVTGDASFVVPADAGLRLFVRGGVGAGIPLVSATAGLEIGGRLGIAGQAMASVHLDWMPGRGLTLDAEGSLSAEPRLSFDVSAFARVEATLIGTLVDRRWQLAAVEYGSGLRFGVRFPIHYEEGRPFDISTDDLQWEIPQIEPGPLLTNLVSQITGG